MSTKITMKNCPKCNTVHEKPGVFCSRQCANSRQWTQEHRQVFSEKQKDYMSREESEGHRYKKSIQSRMLLRAGVMGSNRAVEHPDDVMTDPDDYFLVPPREEHRLFVEEGDVWEVVE